MEKMKYSPESQSYSETYGSTVVSGKLDGGETELRKELENAPRNVSVTWRLDSDGYDYMSAFFRTGVEYGCKSFLIDLWIGYCELKEYEARIVENTWRLTGQSGDEFILSATLSVIPSNQDDDFDNDVLGLTQTPPPIIDFLVVNENSVIISAFRHLNVYDPSQIPPPDIISSIELGGNAPVLQGYPD